MVTINIEISSAKDQFSIYNENYYTQIYMRGCWKVFGFDPLSKIWPNDKTLEDVSERLWSGWELFSSSFACVCMHTHSYMLCLLYQAITN